MAALPSHSAQILHAEALVWAHPTLVGDNELLRTIVADARLWIAYETASRDPERRKRYEDTRASFMGLLAYVSCWTDL